MSEQIRKRIRRTIQPRKKRQSTRVDSETSASNKSVSISENIAAKVIESPDYFVCVIPDCCNGQLSEHDISCIASARLLADDNEDNCQGAVVALFFSEIQTDLGQYGVDRVMQYLIDSYEPDRKAQILNKLIDTLAIRFMVFPDSQAGGADLGRRVAARRGVRAATSIIKLTRNKSIRRAFAGRSEIQQPLSEILLVDNAISVAIKEEHKASELEFRCDDVSSCISDHGLIPFDPEDVKLTESEVVISAGNGVQDWEGFHKLAKLLNVSEGGSRVVIDKGMLKRDKQIGASGNIITARCYIALGISGAPQHMQGINECQGVLSVNIDPDCDMAKRADMAIVGDVQLIIPELISLLENTNNG